MNTHKDFEEFLKLLNDQRVEYVIVGGYAVAFHGYVRATNDLHIFFRNTEQNAQRICRALEEFGFSTSELALHEMREPGTIIRMGVPPVQLELINTVSGLTFDEVWERRVENIYGDVPVNYISLPDLLKNKKAAGRPKDLADFDELGGNRASP